MHGTRVSCELLLPSVHSIHSIHSACTLAVARYLDKLNVAPPPCSFFLSFFLNLIFFGHHTTAAATTVRALFVAVPKCERMPGRCSRLSHESALHHEGMDPRARRAGCSLQADDSALGSGSVRLDVDRCGREEDDGRSRGGDGHSRNPHEGRGQSRVRGSHR